MAKFIEVIPVKYGMDKPKMLINIENISYIREESEVITAIFLKDVPLDGWFGKPEFDNPLNVKTPFMFIADAMLEERGNG
uniref:Uncharacterized protein n=1 Tax=Siphoviridae sp. ct1mp9 TaxID=2826274 RepID=A0A8S5NAT4_9CAUD|nr:MAG TPA: hypothetical protein [Siphoviridae sp. ct1mp9]